MNNNITFILAVQLDCSDRLDNLNITLETIRRGFPNNQVILIESDTENKLAGKYPWCEHVFSQLNSGEVFNKMKLYNKGASLASGSVLCFVDVDVPPSKTAVLEAFKLITSNIYDVIFPYGKAEAYNIPKHLHETVRLCKDVCVYDESKYPWLSKDYQMHYMESGGMVLYNTAAYLHGGGGNENFLGWGCEDDEAMVRFEKLGYRLGRLENCILLHLQHERRANPLWYNYSKYEVANRARLEEVKKMDKEELRLMVESWNNFGESCHIDKSVSVIISGSYLDSHPDTNFIAEVIESLDFTGLPKDTPIILSHDQIRPDTEGFKEKDEAYNKYFKNLEKYISASKYTNIKITVAPEWGHLTRTLEYAMGFVETKYVFVLQHDIHIRREIPVLKMIDLMEKHKHIKHLRFNVRKNLPTFMWWDGYAGGTRQFAEEEYDGVKLCVTPAWSDQNHLATKAYYEELVFPACTNPDGERIYDFMENRMNGLSHHDSKYGTYIYGGWGEPRTSRHSDGRKSSPEPDED